MSYFQSIFFSFLLLFSSSAFAQKAVTPNTKKLEKEIQKILKVKSASQTKIGIFVRDLNSGEKILNIKGEISYNPASNIKLVTSAAAFEKFGAAKTWATRISAGAFKDGEVKTLYIKSDGDPLIQYSHILEWAIRLKQLGVKKITGGIVVDTSAFPDTLPPAFEQFDEDASYRADISSFSVNYNGVTVVVIPGKAGEKARLVMRPPNDHVVIKGEVMTQKGRRSKVVAKATKTLRGTEINMSGVISERIVKEVYRKRVDYPSLYGASIFKTAMQSMGIKVSGKIRNGVRPEKSITLHFHSSEPLWYVMAMMNKFSNNFVAEQTYQLMGIDKEGNYSAEGSNKTLTEFMKKATKKYKSNLDSYQQVNGSGLYVGNKISPRHLVDVLSYMYNSHHYPEFAASLAVGGKDGTLKGRLRKFPAKGNARGKTGTLSAVSALSGYLKTKSGRDVAYSILFNDPPIHGARMRKIQDVILQKIAAYNR